MDQRTRKLKTMHKALHPRDDTDRLYVSRKEGGRGFIISEKRTIKTIQTTAFVRSARIPRRVLETSEDLLSLKLHRETNS